MGSAKQRKSSLQRRATSDSTIPYYICDNGISSGNGRDSSSLSLANDDPNEIRVCEYCHRKGLSSEFYSATKRFCTVGCCHRFSASHQRKRGPKPAGSSRSASRRRVLASASAESGNGSNNSPSVNNGSTYAYAPYPESRPEFDWQDYLLDGGTIAAPSYCFPPREFPPVVDSPFSAGLKVEVSVKSSESSFDCHLGTISQLFGVHIAVTFDGCPPGHEGCVKVLDSPELHPTGWAERMGGRVVPHEATAEEVRADWDNFLKQALDSASTVPASAFVMPKSHVEEAFVVGQKLELEMPVKTDANDATSGEAETTTKSLKSLFHVATVTKVHDDHRISLELDGYDLDPVVLETDSPCLHPVLYCDEQGLKLEPPKGCYDEYFDWNSYLMFSKSEAAPRELFTQTNNMFQAGMKIEAMDIYNAPLVCVATVTDVRGMEVLIHFDGWSAEFDYWADHKSLNIFPVGWCRLHGYILQTPPEDDVGELIEGGSEGNYGQGSDDLYTASPPPPNRKRKSDGHSASPMKASRDRFESSRGRSTQSCFTHDKYDGVPRAVFNIACNHGPFLSSVKMDNLPREICGSTVSAILQSVLQHLIDCGNNPQGIFEEIAAGHSNATVHCVTKAGQRIIKHVQHVEQHQQLWNAISSLLVKLQCCENFIQPRGSMGGCPLCTGRGPASGTYDAPGEVMSVAPAPVHVPTLVLPEEVMTPRSLAVINSLPHRASTSSAHSHPPALFATPSYSHDTSPAPSAPAPAASGRHPTTWSVADVRSYLMSTDCADFAQQLSEQDIDGKALLLLTPDTLVKFMNVRLGPALKICSYVSTLKDRWNV